MHFDVIILTIGGGVEMTENIEDKVRAAQDGVAVEELGSSSTVYGLSGMVFAENLSASPRYYTMEDAYMATIQLKAQYEGG